jgi:hypothetical protein
MATPGSATVRKAIGGKAKFRDRICNLVPSRRIETDWNYTDALGANVLGAPAALPSSVDLRRAWWSINDQGGTGSCVGWACADGLLRYHLVTAGRLPRTRLLSPRFVWMASKETDESVVRPETFIEEAGTTLKAAVDIIRKYGCAREDELPFQIGTLMHTGPANAFFASAATRKAASYFNLDRNLQQWKAWLATQGPILAGLAVDDTWRDASATKGKLDTFDRASVNGGHAVCIVGYTATRFIIRNSWGKAWGDKGFGHASLAYMDDAFFPEAYGITL